MPRPPWAASAVLLLALAAPASAQPTEPTGTRLDFFTPRRDVFHPLIADPREIQLSAAYYRLGGNNTADVALGHSWGMARWTTQDEGWKLQWNVEGMAYSRFKLSGGVNEFDTVDFFAQLPVEFRRGIFSGRAMLFHQSSHLGDDYIRRTRDVGFRYSIDGLRAHASLDAFKGLRLYAGPTFLLNTVPAPERWAAQAGFEALSRRFSLFGRSEFQSFLYLAQDVQSREQSRWNLNSRTVLGLRTRWRDQPRAVRVQLGYFEGHSPYGQFYVRREHYTDLTIALEL